MCVTLFPFNFKEYLNEILVSVVSAGIIGLMTWLYKRFLNSRPRFTPLLGEYIGYYFIKSDQLLMEQKITITLSWNFRFKIEIIEKSSAKYQYKGYLYFEDDRLFGFLKGKKHPARSFISMIYPFNRGEKIQSLNGIFAGITQDKNPAAIKVHWSRHVKSEEAIRLEFDPQQTKHIVVKKDTVENELVKDISPTLKK